MFLTGALHSSRTKSLANLAKDSNESVYG